MYKHNWGVESWSTWNKSSWLSEPSLNWRSPDFKNGSRLSHCVTLLPTCQPLEIKGKVSFSSQKQWSNFRENFDFHCCELKHITFYNKELGFVALSHFLKQCLSDSRQKNNISNINTQTSDKELFIQCPIILLYTHWFTKLFCIHF